MFKNNVHASNTLLLKNGNNRLGCWEMMPIHFVNIELPQAFDLKKEKRVPEK
jgi:hypothetical protein